MPPQSSTPISDKVFWHGYTDFYERFFSTRKFHQIAEFGIFKGGSIQWLLQRFPMAQISGADILPFQSNWPNDPRVEYTQLDQSSRKQIHDFLSKRTFDLIIEDGSHLPIHQINCLVEGMEALASKGIYILEDVQTSKKNHPLWNQNNSPWHFRKFKRKRLFLEGQELDKGNALNLLLGIDHYIRLGNGFDYKAIIALAKNSLFSINEIKQLTEQIKEVHLYKRTRLPDYCYDCGSKDFSFSELQCICGRDIFSDCDSMSFVIIKK